MEMVLPTSCNTVTNVEDDDLELVVLNGFLHAVSRSSCSRKRQLSCPAVMERNSRCDDLESVAPYSTPEQHDTKCNGCDSASCSTSDGYAAWSDKETSTEGDSTLAEEDARQEAPLCAAKDDCRTVMVKNVPCRCKVGELRDAIESLGCGGGLEFLHIPVKKGHKTNGGYAFVGFTSHAAAVKLQERMSGYRFPSRQSDKVINVVPAHIQGRTHHYGQCNARRQAPAVEYWLGTY